MANAVVIVGFELLTVDGDEINVTDPVWNYGLAPHVGLTLAE